MAKILPYPSKWSKCLPLFYRRFLAMQIGSLRNKTTSCVTERKCKPKDNSCLGHVTDCPKNNWSPCSEPDTKTTTNFCCTDSRLIERPCEKPKKKLGKKQEKKPFKSMWETGRLPKKCVIDERFDDSHYKPSDATKRKYTQTWKSCEPIVRTRKVCCINEMCMLPPLEKRLKKIRLETAKEHDTEQLKLNYDVIKSCLDEVMENSKSKDKNKCKQNMKPQCRKVVKIRKCFYRPRTKCSRECCPYPSFSECEHASVKQDLPVECRCPHFVSQCEVSRYLVLKKIFSLPPPLPAWPPNERPK